MKVENRINEFIYSENWPEARKLIRAEQIISPNSHWLMTRLSSTYYEERKYKMALIVSKRALKLDPRCPLVLWDYACVLDMLGKEKVAIKIWQDILQRGEQAIAFDKCGEGISWARSLLNDCRYRIASSLLYIGRKMLGKRYMVEHLRHRRQGVRSCYSLSDVRAKLKQFHRS